MTLHNNWGGVTGLRGTGSEDCSVENILVPQELTFSWDLLNPKPLRGGPGYRMPPFAYVAKEHGSVAIGAARRALDELIAIATTTRGAFQRTRVLPEVSGDTDLGVTAFRFGSTRGGAGAAAAADGA